MARLGRSFNRFGFHHPYLRSSQRDHARGCYISISAAASKDLNPKYQMSIRDYINIVEAASAPKPFIGTVFHGSPSEFKTFRMDDERGIYFSGDYDYAKGYGDFVYEAKVSLRHPIWYNEQQADSDMEISRPLLISQGYDGRIVAYDNGEMDVIAFYLEQITKGFTKLNSI